MKAIALLGGPTTQWPAELSSKLNQARKQGELLLGVDRGSLLLKELGFVPDLAVGDFDSLKKRELFQLEQDVPDIRYSVPEKDLTDTELMVKYAFKDYQVDALTLVGSTGGRLDHFLNNLLIVLRPEFKAYTEKIKIWDQQNLVSFYQAGKHVVHKLPTYKYVGVAPLTQIEKLTISGAKYDLSGYSSKVPVSFSSNEFLPTKKMFEISFTQGTLAVIQSKDLDRYQDA